MTNKKRLTKISKQCNILISDIVNKEPILDDLYDCKIMSDFDNFLIFNKHEDERKLAHTIPSRKELRLSLEMVNQRYPLYKKADLQTKTDFIKEIFNFKISVTNLEKLKSFKQIIKKTRIVMKNNKPKLVTVIRYRNPKYMIYL